MIKHLTGKPFYLVPLILLLFSLRANADDFIEIDGNIIQFNYGDDRIAFQTCKENIIKLNFIPDGVKDSSTFVIEKQEWLYNSAFIDTSGDPVTISTNKLLIEIGVDVFFIRIVDHNIGEIFYLESFSDILQKQIRCKGAGGNIYGIYNNRSGSLTKKSGGEISAGHQGEGGAPFIWSTSGWGMLCDMDGGEIEVQNPYLSFIRDPNDNRASFEIYVFSGSPSEIFDALTDVTGKPPLFPKYSLGFINTEWGMDESELLDDIRTYKKKNIPIDVYVLDFDWMAYGEDNYGEFRWGSRFPSALDGSLKRELDSLGVKIFGIRKPRIHLNTVQGDYCVDNGYFVDYTTDYFTGKRVGRLNFLDSRVRDWYWNSFINIAGSYDKGLIGYWNDEADEYGGNFMFMNMQRSNYEGQRNYNNKRVFSINRNFYLGAQRYAYAHWSGDIATGFNSMAAQRLFMLSSINLGSGWWSMDTGGFSGTPSQENYIRWLQFSTFVPLMRVHGSRDEEREPWQYGEISEEIGRRYIRLRHALIPYIYSYAHENNVTGVSIVRAMHFMYPEDNSLADMIDQWFFGNEIFVHPVIEPAASSVHVYIPEGLWLEYWTGKKFRGPAYVDVPVTIDNIPVFIKAGAIIPMHDPSAHINEQNAAPSLLRIVSFPDGSGSFEMYEDDGLTYDYENGLFSITKLHSQNSESCYELTIESGIGPYNPPDRDYLAEFPYMKYKPDSVLLDEEKIFENKYIVVTDSSATGWYYDVTGNKTFVRINDDRGGHSIKVFIQPDTIAPTIDSVKCFDKNTLNVYFSEIVFSGQDPHSAERIENYHIDKDVLIYSATISLNGSTVVLKTSDHAEGETYYLTVYNVADQSNAKNIMEEHKIQYICEKNEFMFEEIQQGLNGFQGTSDSHIAEFFPDNNMGGYFQFECCRYDGANENDDKSILIKFDLKNIDIQKDNLLSAELALTLLDTRNGFSDKSIACNRLLRTWQEGDINVSIDGEAAPTGVVTWASALHGVLPWLSGGGDFRQEAVDEIIVGNGISSEYRWEITPSLLFWLANPDSNYGLVLREKISSSVSGTKVFASSENDNFRIRPKIILTYACPTRTPFASALNPEKFVLYQSYPNPFNSNCNIIFDLPEEEVVTLHIFNISGQSVKRILNEHMFASGSYQINWDGRDESGASVSSGVYIYSLSTHKFSDSRKMLFLK